MPCEQIEGGDQCGESGHEHPGGQSLDGGHEIAAAKGVAHRESAGENIDGHDETHLHDGSDESERVDLHQEGSIETDFDERAEDDEQGGVLSAGIIGQPFELRLLPEFFVFPRAFPNRGLQPGKLGSVVLYPAIDGDTPVGFDFGDPLLHDRELPIVHDGIQLEIEVAKKLGYVLSAPPSPAVDPGQNLVVNVVRFVRIRQGKVFLAALAPFLPDAVVSEPGIGIQPDVFFPVGVEPRLLVQPVGRPGVRVRCRLHYQPSRVLLGERMTRKSMDGFDIDLIASARPARGSQRARTRPLAGSMRCS